MKQVIVIRKDLNMRKGKMCAQAAHASLGIALRMHEQWVHDAHMTYKWSPESVKFAEWRDGLQKKICVSVDSESELLLVYENAKHDGLPCYLVQDMGLTEFKEPTYTAVAIGPAEDHDVDRITGHLKLL